MAIHAKVKAGGIAGTVLTLLVGVLAIVGVDIPDTAVAAAGTLVTFFAAWIKTGEVPADGE